MWMGKDELKFNYMCLYNVGYNNVAHCPFTLHIQSINVLFITSWAHSIFLQLLAHLTDFEFSPPPHPRIWWFVIFNSWWRLSWCTVWESFCTHSSWSRKIAQRSFVQIPLVHQLFPFPNWEALPTVISYWVQTIKFAQTNKPIHKLAVCNSVKLDKVEGHSRGRG